MHEHRLRVVDAPRNQAILVCEPRGPSHDRSGGDAYLCGDCGTVLLRNVAPHDVEDVVLPCSTCGAWNRPMPHVESRTIRENEGIRRVVVVDDEPDVLDLVCEILDLEGFETVCLGDPEEARHLGDEAQPDLVLMDMMLPGTTGIELARELRTKRGVDAPMVAMSASSSMLDRASDSALFVDMLPKPFDLPKLVQLVQRHAL